MPEADALLASVATRHPGIVREGVSAHVSLMYPFVAASEIDEEVTCALGELFVEQAPMMVEFGECYHRAGFVALRPDPIDGLIRLVNAVRHQWPELMPYRGVYGDVEPHVTLALRSSEEMAMTVKHEVSTELPILAELREAWLVVFQEQWTVRQRYEFSACGQRWS